LAPGLSRRALLGGKYGLLVALIAVVCLLAIAFFGSSLSGSLDRSGQSIVSVGG